VSAVVSDSGPLNYLALLSDFDLLRQIYHTVVIPSPRPPAPRRWLPFAVPSISTSVKARRFWSRKRSGMHLF
jgi:predicted nucleic acid-binding protein